MLWRFTTLEYLEPQTTIIYKWLAINWMISNLYIGHGYFTISIRLKLVVWGSRYLKNSTDRPVLNVHQIPLFFHLTFSKPEPKLTL